MNEEKLKELQLEREELLLRKTYWRKKVGNVYVPIMIMVGIGITIIHLFVGIASLVGVLIFSRAIGEHMKAMQDDYIDILKEIRELEDEGIKK